MTTTHQTQLDFERNEQQPLRDFIEQAYLNYSMYVILDRALPHIGDGLKPVQRRIIYAMSELGLKAASKYKKSARTVGDVIGKFHPHGDAACYEAMVLMAQAFSFRYPLIDGQGNWGSIDDPKSFAAMRYTESKLTPYAENLLAELRQGAVDWLPNFDGTLREPVLLPARLPNILLNGATGIAVGMTTDIPPHNLGEVVAACVCLLESERADVAELCRHVRGPDFPTHAEIITPHEALVAIYESGQGSVKMRATWTKEDGNIVVTALPYQSSGSKIIEQIAAQMQAKKLPMLDDCRDESDHENATRIVLIPRSNRVDCDELMLHLFATTDLERSCRVNMNVVGMDGRPRVMDLKTLLREWLSQRLATVTKRLERRLADILERLHILEALLIVYLNIEQVIEIIRHHDHPKPALMERFRLSDAQAEGILELKLRKLAKLEELKIKQEMESLQREKADLQLTLSSKRRLKTLVRKELQADAEQFGDRRRSPLVERDEARALQAANLFPAEDISVILSARGWVRKARGHNVDPHSLGYRSEDGFKCAAIGRSDQNVVFLDSTGRCYTLPADRLPSSRGHGEPVSSKFNPPDGASFEGLMLGAPDAAYLMASDAGYGFVSRLGDLFTKNKSGRAVVKLPAQARVLTPCEAGDPAADLVAAVSSDGRLLVFPLSELPLLAKGKGLKIIQIPPARLKTREEYVAAVAVLAAGAALTLQCDQRHLTLKPDGLARYTGARGSRGALLPRGLRRVLSLSGAPS